MSSSLHFGQRFSIYTPTHDMMPNDPAPAEQVKDIAKSFNIHNLSPVLLTTSSRQAELETAGLPAFDFIGNQQVFSYQPTRSRGIEDPADILLTDRDAEEFLAHYKALATVNQAAADQYVTKVAGKAKGADTTVRLELNA